MRAAGSELTHGISVSQIQIEARWRERGDDEEEAECIGAYSALVY